jgi:gliding motility-associated transport system permease protein
MRTMWYIARREYRSYFSSPIAYVVLFLILLTLGFFFWQEIVFAVQYQQQYIPDIKNTLQLFVFPLLFIFAPAITMRTFAEENRQGTLELMLTAPVRDWELVVGKWLGSFFFFLTAVAITWVYPLILNSLINPGIDQGALLAAYLGLILMIAAMCAIGVFVSSLFSNQLAALAGSVVLIILLWVIGTPANTMTGTGADILRYLSISDHFYNTFLTGVIDLKDVTYYLSMTALGLFLGTVSVETRRWR